MAEEIEVSRRSVYRDITDLIGQGVPIVGEAGFGYVLDPGYDMPPLMLTPTRSRRSCWVRNGSQHAAIRR